MTLEPHEHTRLRALEQTVGDGLRDFQRTGQALSEIRDNGLYRATHDSFEAYLQERWGFGAKQAERLIGAAEVARVLAPLGIQPQNEAQARKFRAAAQIITELEPEQQRVVARLAERPAPPEGASGDEGSEDVPWDVPPDAAELKIMANVVRRLTPDTTVYHPESGEEAPLGSLAPAQRFEVIKTHVEQKTQAHHERQAARAQKEPAEKVNWTAWCLEYAQQGLNPAQRLELVIEQGEGGRPRVFAQVVDKTTGEVLAEGEAAGGLRGAVLSLLSEVQG